MGKCLWLGLAALFAAAAARVAIAEQIEFSAAELYELGAAKDVRLTPDRSAIELTRGVLIEDDGPAAGFSYKPNEERLAPGVQIKKTLVVDDPRASAVTLLIGGKGEFQLGLNGQPCPGEASGKSGNYWFHHRLPVDRLRTGANEFVLSGKGSVWIARYDEFAGGTLTRHEPVNRSARSTDEGKTWNASELGPQGDIAGEYCIRLQLDQFRPEGSLLLPVMDSGNLHRRSVAPALDRLPALTLVASAEASDDGEMVWYVRCGSHPDLDRSDPDKPDTQTADWSTWKEIPHSEMRAGSRGPEAAASPASFQMTGRYFQLRCRLRTSNRLKSPSLHSLKISTDLPPVLDSTRKIVVKELHNQVLTPSAIPFQYEPLERQELKQLREEQRLDEVVAGARDELELIARLARWTSAQWKHPGHIGKVYPPWNAVQILKPHEDGTPIGGFCQQYAVVFLQACESFGLVGRSVSLSPGAETSLGRSGHETTEIWSNQFGKWIYVDGNMAWYAVDEHSGIPLSLLELRDRQLKTLRQQAVEPTRIVRLADTKPAWTGLDVWPPFVEMRMIPRSNFLEARAPLPLNQGMRGWFWPDHYVWAGDEPPSSLLYHHYVQKRSDWDWKVNQAQLWLEATDSPGKLRVQVATNMPSFETFVAKFDDREPAPIASSFQWQLNSGRNRLEIWPRNKLGRLGIATSATVEYSGSP